MENKVVVGKLKYSSGNYLEELTKPQNTPTKHGQYAG